MICFNFASRSRPEKFFACLENLREMCGEPYYVLAKIDIDQKGAYENIRNYDEVFPKLGKSISKVHAINRDIHIIGFDIIANHSDDMWFTKPFTIDCGPDEFVHYPDQVVGDKLCTYSIMGVDYYRRFKYIYHPAYKSLWCDNEATEVAKILGRYRYIPEQILEHRHPANGIGAYDEQYRKTERYYWIDKRVYDMRKRKNFDL